MNVNHAQPPATYSRNQPRSAQQHNAEPCLRLPSATIEERAHQLLMSDCSYAFCFRDVEFQFADGVLTVRGRVPSFYLKQVLQSKLKGLTGVKYIDNQVDVVSSTGLSSTRSS